MQTKRKGGGAGEMHFVDFQAGNHGGVDDVMKLRFSVRAAESEMK